MRKAVLGALAALVLALAVTGGVFWAKGYRVYVIHTGSMVPTYRPGSVVVDGPAPKTVQVGEVITFRHSDLTSDVVTHRVVGVTAAGLIHTKGDANATPDAWDIRPDQVRGTTRFSVPGLGYLLVFLKQPTGIGALATALFGLIALWSVCVPPEPSSSGPGGGAHRRARGARHRLTVPA
jgi:signal peptidase I